jgi:hypothetical protein
MKRQPAGLGIPIAVALGIIWTQPRIAEHNADSERKNA